MITENQDIYSSFIEDMNTNDLFLMIKQHSRNTDSLATNINSILIKADGSRLAKELNKEWEEYCDDKQICTCCGGEIKIIENKYYKNEEDFIKYCENCR